MSTVFIDRTLSYLTLKNNFVEKSELMKYINSVFSCGADYIEINSTVLEFLKDEDLSQKYIFRITSIADMKLSFDYDFAYISLPLSLSPFFEKLAAKHSIIAEIFTDEYSVMADLLTLKNHTRLNTISMVRLTGIVATTPENSHSLVSWYKHNLHIPLDICPLNTMLSGSGDAVSFLRARADSISLSFGNSNYYTSFEDFLINRQISQRSPMPQEVIAAMCSASLAYMWLFNALPSGMERIAIKDSPVMAPVYDIENGVVYRPFRPVSKKPKNQENIIEKQIRTIGLEREIEDAIIDMLKKTNYSFYQNITKRNIID